MARLAELAGVALAAAAVSFAGIGSHSLWTPDEPRDAAIGKAMWASGDLAMPRLDGRPFLEKPPLAWWAQAAAYRAFGVSDTVARVPSALCATLTLLVTYALGRRLGGRRAGWLAAGALASTAEFSEDMGRAIVDPPLVLMVTLAYAGFVVLVTAPGDAGAAGGGGGGASMERRGAELLIALAVPLAFLAKGVVGIGLALGPPVLYLLATAGRSGPRQGPGTVRLLAPLALLGVPLFAVLVLPWTVALVREAGWAALRECLVGNTVGRLLATEAGRAFGHRQPFWYYLPAGAAALLPWSLALPAGLRAAGGDDGNAGSAAARREGAEDGRRLLIASCFIGVALLSLAASKRSLYLVPLLPALAVPIGLWLDRLDRAEGSRWDRATALLLLVLAAIVPAALWIGAWQAVRGAFSSFPAAPLRAELTESRLAIAGAVAAAGAALLLVRCARHLRDGTTPTGPWLALPFLAIALVYQTAIKAAVDPLKNLHDMTAAIARLDPGAGPVAAYRPSETTLGIIGFDLGRPIQILSGPAEVDTFLATRPDGRLVLSLGAFRQLPPPLRARLRLLYDETGAKASPFAIACALGR